MQHENATFFDETAGSLDLSEGHRDEALYHVAVLLRRGGCDPNTANSIVKKLAEQCDPPFDPRQAEEKVRSAYSRPGIERSFAEDVRGWVLMTPGDILITDVYAHFGLLTRTDKLNVQQIFHRMVKDNLIIRGKKRGHYIVPDTMLEVLDPNNLPYGEFLPIEFPLDLHRVVGLYPGTIAIINGVKDAGKTGFLLRFVAMNQDRWPGRIHYFNSEMGEVELGRRLAAFEEVTKWNFRLYNRNYEFSSVIRPDDINIIDFLEVHDEFWRIGEMLFNIHSRLRNGCALIALQKNPGAPVGLGGYRSIEKARLVLNIEPGELVIHTAKGWVDPLLNPRGTKIKFKLARGCIWVREDPTYKEEGVFDPATMSVRRSKGE